MIACYKGHYKIAKYLMEQKADVNRKSIKGNTALHDCAESGSLEIMKLLLASGARIDVDAYGKNLSPAPNYCKSLSPATGYGKSLSPAPKYGKSLSPAPKYGKNLSPGDKYGKSLPPVCLSNTISFQV